MPNPNIVPLHTQRSDQPALRQFTPGQLATIKRTVAKDCNDAEFDLFMEVARRSGLDPFRRQIHAVVYSKNNPEKRKLSIITGIDGFRAIAARCGDYGPGRTSPEITYRDELKNPKTNPLGIEKAVVTLYKFGPDKEWHPVVGEAFWEEFAPLTEVWEYDEQKNKRVPTGIVELDPKSNWYRMPRVMLPKCATAQACRAGWPEDFSGLYVDAEMDQAGMLDITASAEVELHEKERRLALVGAKDAISILWRAGDAIEQVPIGKMADRCMAFFRESESDIELEWWWRTNEPTLREFWARAKSDALAVKKAHEERIAQLQAATGETGAA